MSELIDRAAANCAGAYRQWAVRTGHHTQLWPDVSTSDFGVPGSGPIDSAVLLRPVQSEGDWAGLLERVSVFFAAREGGPIQIWSAWPTPVPAGWSAYQVPALIRPPGGQVPAPAAGLEITTTRARADFVDVAHLVDKVFDCRASDPAALFGAGLLGEDFEVFVGRVDGTPVATASAFVSDQLCGVYAVATDSSARGRGFGAALAWRATCFRPDLPAALQASPMGYPVYLRMGYREFGWFQLLQGPRRPPA